VVVKEADHTPWAVLMPHYLAVTLVQGEPMDGALRIKDDTVRIGKAKSNLAPRGVSGETIMTKKIAIAFCLLVLVPSHAFAQGATYGPNGDVYIHTPGATYGPRGETYIHTPGATYTPRGEAYIHTPGATYTPKGETYIHTPGATFGPHGETYIQTPGVTYGPNGETWIHAR
jgi:hypothetical protein